MIIENAAQLAVSLERYSKPQKAWGFHVLVPVAPGSFNPMGYPYRNRVVGLFGDENEGHQALRKHGRFTTGLKFSALKPELQSYIVAQVLPMEWKSRIMTDPDLQSKVYLWVTREVDRTQVCA